MALGKAHNFPSLMPHRSRSRIGVFLAQQVLPGRLTEGKALIRNAGWERRKGVIIWEEW